MQAAGDARLSNTPTIPLAPLTPPTVATFGLCAQFRGRPPSLRSAPTPPHTHTHTVPTALTMPTAFTHLRLGGDASPHLRPTVLSIHG